MTLAALAAPRLDVDRPQWDFGVVTNVLQISHVFILRNVGQEPLEVRQVLSGCDPCLRTILEQKIIPPSGKAELSCQLDLRSLSGPVARTVTLECNDPAQPWFVLGITGFVVPAYQLTPSEIRIDMTQGQRWGMAEILSLVPLRAPLSVVECSDPHIAASVSAVASNRFLLTVQAAESLPRGQWVVQLMVRSPDSNDPPCQVKASLRHPPELEILPPRLRFQARAEPQMRMVWLNQHAASPLVLLDAIPSSDRFHCEIEPDPIRLAYRIYVTAWRLEEEGGRDHAIQLKMRDRAGSERLLSVPVSVEPVSPADVGGGYPSADPATNGS